MRKIDRIKQLEKEKAELQRQYGALKKAVRDRDKQLEELDEIRQGAFELSGLVDAIIGFVVLNYTPENCLHIKGLDPKSFLDRYSVHTTRGDGEYIITVEEKP